MAARPYASTGRGSGAWSVRTSSQWAFIELRMPRPSQRSGSPSAISKANRCRGRRTGLETRRSDTLSDKQEWEATEQSPAKRVGVATALPFSYDAKPRRTSSPGGVLMLRANDGHRQATPTAQDPQRPQKQTRLFKRPGSLRRLWYAAWRVGSYSRALSGRALRYQHRAAEPTRLLSHLRAIAARFGD
jgi:hypothetical protein